MQTYLLYFLTGSTILTTLHFLISVQNIPYNLKNYSYYNYSILAPFFLGIFNIIGYILSILLNLNKNGIIRYLVTAILTSTIVFYISYNYDAYNFTKKEEWLNYYITILAKHILTYVVIIRTLDLLIL